MSAHGRLRTFATAALAVLLALCVFEVVARQVQWIPYESHPRLGSVPAANKTARYCREGCGTSHWIAGGIRRATPLDPALGTIVVLGDSFTEALMTDDERVFTQLAEERLRAAGAPVQIANVGRSGASAAEYVALAPYYQELVAPRWVVVQLRAPDLEGDSFDPAKTHFERTADGGVRAVEVVRNTSRWHEYLAPLRRYSALASFARMRLLEFAAAAEAEPPLFRATQPPAQSAAVSYPIEAELDAIAAAYDGRVTFLFLPEFVARDPDRVGPTEQIFVARCAARGWSCANLRDRFARFAEEHASPYGSSNFRYNAGHMNDAGHAATADVLVEALERVRANDLL